MHVVFAGEHRRAACRWSAGEGQGAPLAQMAGRLPRYGNHSAALRADCGALRDLGGHEERNESDRHLQRQVFIVLEERLRVPRSMGLVHTWIKMQHAEKKKKKIPLVVIMRVLHVFTCSGLFLFYVVQTINIEVRSACSNNAYTQANTQAKHVFLGSNLSCTNA